MQMFSIPKKTAKNAGASIEVRRISTLIKPIDFEPVERAPVRCESANKFSKEFV